MAITYSQADFESALDAGIAKAVQTAVEPLQARIAEMESAQADSEVEAKVLEAQEAAEATVAEIQGKLDEAEVRASAAAQELADVQERLTAEAEAAEAAAVVAARRDERTAAVAEFNFPEDHVTASLDAWCAMDDAFFASLTEGWRQVAASTKTPPSAAPAALANASAMSTTRTTAAASGAAGKEDLRALAALSQKISLGSL